MLLKKERLHCTHSCLLLPLLLRLMAVRRDHPFLMDAIPLNLAPVTQVRWPFMLASFCLSRCTRSEQNRRCTSKQVFLSWIFLTYAEPSTSRAALNFQDYVLSRPPLSHSHLHFSPLDTSSPTLGAPSSLFSQPSTSSAPGPFSTGFSLVKEIKDNLSQHEDDNISTTSGFSSRASDKGRVEICLDHGTNDYLIIKSQCQKATLVLRYKLLVCPTN